MRTQFAHLMNKGATLPQALDQAKSRVKIGPFAASNVHGIEDPRAFDAIGVDNAFDLEEFKRNFRVEIKELDEERIVFDMIGVSAPIANAFRRILIAEVPTMAIDKIHLYQNTSIIQDEVLVHRLGLIPIKVDPRKFKFPKEVDDSLTPESALVFTLHAVCKAKKGGNGEEEVLENSEVYSGDLKWVPQGNQEEEFGDDVPKPVIDNILIARMRPGQEIEAELFVEKGIGRDHTKWSPVCTASYKLLPEVKIVKGISSDEADAFVKSCPMGVFDIEDGVPTVTDSRKCTLCRECIRNPLFQDKVELNRVRDHFICMLFRIVVVDLDVLL
jgi:DNA-directed RNA polymerase I and III subunit RPAC1